MKNTSQRLFVMLGAFLSMAAVQAQEASDYFAPAVVKGDTVYFYFNEDWKPIDNSKVASYYRKQTPQSRTRFHIRDYYRTGELQMIALTDRNDPLYSDADYYGEKVHFHITGDTSDYYFYNEEGKREGRHFTTHENGQLEWEASYEDGKKQGQERGYYANGQLKYEHLYEKGEWNGGYVKYDSTGVLVVKGKYREGKRIGKWEFFHSNGAKEYSRDYRDGKIVNGVYVDYYDNGNVSDSGRYANGEKQGPWVFRYKNGTLRTKKSYGAGEVNGKVVEYDSNGVLVSEGQYVNGKPNGEIKTYYTNGQLKSKRVHDNAWKAVSGETYWDDGSVQQRWGFRKGELERTYYSREGKKLKAPKVSTFPEPKTNLLEVLQSLDYHTEFRTSDGQLIVSFRVNEQGQMVDAEVVESGNRYVDSLVMQGIESFAFQPGTAFEKTIEFSNAVRITYNKSGFTTSQFGYYHPENLSREDEVPLFVIVEQMPVFPGGEEKLFQHLGQEVRYPEDAMNKSRQGVVYVNFVVDRSGLITNARIIRGVYPSIDQEALRVVRNMPAWEPGKQRDIPVRVMFNLPIRFTLR